MVGKLIANLVTAPIKAVSIVVERVGLDDEGTIRDFADDLNDDIQDVLGDENYD